MGWIIYALLITFFLFISVLANLALFGVAIGGGHGGGLTAAVTHRSQYEEQFVDGEDSAKDKIAVIYVDGVISSAEDGYAARAGWWRISRTSCSRRSMTST